MWKYKGKNDLMPSGAQFNNVHIRPLQLLLMSARDRRCFFYVFELPGPWTSIFTLCEDVMHQGLCHGLEVRDSFVPGSPKENVAGWTQATLHVVGAMR